MKILATFVIAFALLGLSASAQAGWFSDEDETPPSRAKPLSEIIKTLEDQGYRTITEVEFEDGAREIEVHQDDGEELELRVDPETGEVEG